MKAAAKRAISALLVLIMVMALCPMGVLAADPEVKIYDKDNQEISEVTTSMTNTGHNAVALHAIVTPKPEDVTSGEEAGNKFTWISGDTGIVTVRKGVSDIYGDSIVQSVMLVHFLKPQSAKGIHLLIGIMTIMAPKRNLLPLLP